MGMGINRTAIAAVAIVIACGCPVLGQVRVTKGPGGKTSIDLSGYGAAGGSSAQFLQTLRSDLNRSGWFVEAARGRSEVTLSGACTEAGGRLRAECAVVGVANRRTYLNKAFTSAGADPRVFAHLVSDAIVEAVTGRRGMASAKVVMVGTRTNAKELYIAGSDGQGLVQLTQDRTVSVAPRWGPGNQVVYTSFLKGYPDVYLVDVQSGSRQRISNYAGLNTGADISPDGQSVVLVLSKDGNPEVYVKSLRTDRLTRVTRTNQAAEASPCWSPDGQRIAYVSDASGRPHLYLVDRTGTGGKRLTSLGTENLDPDWGGDGRIAYCTRRDGRYQIAVLDPNTMADQAVPTPDNADYENPSWAPDGRHIACTRTENHRAKVYILDTLGDAPVALTGYQGDWYSPSWSP